MQGSHGSLPVVILPSGTFECHADHLPLGLDALKMYGIAGRLARERGAVLLPLRWFGVVGFDEMRGSTTFSKDLVKQVAKKFFANIEKMGAKVIASVTGHYGPYQVSTVKRAAQEYMAAQPVRIAAVDQPAGRRARGTGLDMCSC